MLSIIYNFLNSNMFVISFSTVTVEDFVNKYGKSIFPLHPGCLQTTRKMISSNVFLPTSIPCLSTSFSLLMLLPFPIHKFKK
ncbi:hypothetical protein LINPERHAP1_LOCUS34836, partial [Linum perenne]